MEIIKVNLSGDWKEIDQKIIELAAGVIERNGAIIFPTDTVYGLGVRALNEYAIDRLFKIKKRPETKPVPVMVRDIKMARKLAYFDRKKEKILEQVWPGQVTVVLEKREVVPSILTAGQRTIGLRIADHPFVSALMEKLNEPITATSANFSGEPPMISSSLVIKTFEKAYPRPDLILDAGDLPISPPSTVLDLTSSKPKILRIGPVTKKDLMKMLK
ncbi:MAG: L-threonylcarbamoyladenylate synthase [Patescibacteria group bacterium]